MHWIFNSLPFSRLNTHFWIIYLLLGFRCHAEIIIDQSSIVHCSHQQHETWNLEIKCAIHSLSVRMNILIFHFVILFPFFYPEKKMMMARTVETYYVSDDKFAIFIKLMWTWNRRNNLHNWVQLVVVIKEIWKVYVRSFSPVDFLYHLSPIHCFDLCPTLVAVCPSAISDHTYNFEIVSISNQNLCRSNINYSST